VKATAFRNFFTCIRHRDTNKWQSVHGWLPVLPSLCNPWYLSHTRNPHDCSTGVCYACVDVELTICISRPSFSRYYNSIFQSYISSFAFSVPALSTLTFLFLHFRTRIFQYRILALKLTWHHWSRIFWSCIFRSRIFSAPLTLRFNVNAPTCLGQWHFPLRARVWPSDVLV